MAQWPSRSSCVEKAHRGWFIVGKNVATANSCGARNQWANQEPRGCSNLYIYIYTYLKALYLPIAVRANAAVCAARGSYLPIISDNLTPLLNIFLHAVGIWWLKFADLMSTLYNFMLRFNWKSIFSTIFTYIKFSYAILRLIIFSYFMIISGLLNCFLSFTHHLCAVQSSFHVILFNKISVMVNLQLRVNKRKII